MGLRTDGGRDLEIRMQAGQDMVVLLQDWKKRMKRRRIYRFCLCTALFLSFTVLTAGLYYNI